MPAICQTQPGPRLQVGSFRRLVRQRTWFSSPKGSRYTANRYPSRRQCIWRAFSPENHSYTWPMKTMYRARGQISCCALEHLESTINSIRKSCRCGICMSEQLSELIRRLGILDEEWAALDTGLEQDSGQARACRSCKQGFARFLLLRATKILVTAAIS